MWSDSTSQSATAAVVDQTSEVLWRRYREDRSTENRNRLVIYYAPLVASIAGGLASRMAAFQSCDDLCSCRQFGLIDAIERFDPSEGFQFATYATIRIRGAILDEVRKEDVLPKRSRAKVRAYRDVRDLLEAEFHRTPTLREIAERLDVPIVDALELRDLATLGGPLTTLTAVFDHHSGASDRNDPGATDRADRASLREAVRNALIRLTERQRQALVLHFLEGFKKSEVADTLGVDRSRVTQLIHQGLINLRLELEGCDIAFAD